ncbi:hypothetical protein CC85DRAFT_287291 [Cutaneotrichosporon oleaginosum]|uniref:Zn(2)-C6 fungal-type domain-containing protein n=1 Tax=Cutaneotrichosporon oleaginosum TaxID=879819 RepID=A0A0J0XHT4_9TREE|nr:uncharacterized protein CC85DRAFT_287291 [Cutaneotrichosporon oleaginosum]KLT40567.1 hypothetical protein CC85DRAFT_287291 [Cutaneotrichosporon oleaginosum]
MAEPPRQRQACIGCRAIKAKCQQTDTLQVPCTRCKRLALSCEFTRQKRGRKSNVERERLRDQRATRSASPVRSAASLQRSGPPASQPSGSALGSEAKIMARAPTFMAGLSASSIELTPRSPDEPSLQQSPLKMPTVAGTRRHRVDVSEYLDPGEPEALLDIAPGRRSMEDPLALGLVSVAEARALVELFHQHLNPPLALLDPAYHTLAFMHESSFALLTAVLAAASKFFHGPETYRALLDHAQVLINRAVAEGHCEIGMIQCLMVLSHFKDTRDRTAWIKIGMALRFAYQNGLHKALQDVDTPRTSEGDRAQLNLERTWFCMCCFDSTYSHLFLLPLAIPASQRGDVDRWAHNHLGLGPPSDLRLACSVEALDVASQVHALKVNSTTKEYRAALLPQILSQIDRHDEKWFNGRLCKWELYESSQRHVCQSTRRHPSRLDSSPKASLCG